MVAAVAANVVVMRHCNVSSLLKCILLLFYTILAYMTSCLCHELQNNHNTQPQQQRSHHKHSNFHPSRDGLSNITRRYFVTTQHSNKIETQYTNNELKLQRTIRSMKTAGKDHDVDTISGSANTSSAYNKQFNSENELQTTTTTKTKRTTTAMPRTTRRQSQSNLKHHELSTSNSRQKPRSIKVPLLRTKRGLQDSKGTPTENLKGRPGQGDNLF